MTTDDFRLRQQKAFGARIRQLRNDGRLKGVELAAQAGVTQPTISKIETGRILPSVEVLERIAGALDLAADVRDELLEELNRINTEVATWRRSGGRGEAKQRVIGERDREASDRRSYHPTVVPGLLQTAEYARAVFARSLFLTNDEERARAVAARMDRQTVLYTDGRRLEFIIGESALRVRLGAPNLQLAQLDRISALSSLSNVKIGIIPLDAEVPRVVPNGFALYDDERVVVETYTSEITLTDERDVEAYRLLFADLQSIALYDADAQALLAEIARTIRSAEHQP